MEEALTTLVLGHAPLRDLVGGRVHWLRQPRDAEGFPYVNLTLVSDLHAYHMEGPSGLHRTRVQTDTWAETYGTATSVRRALTDHLSGFRGREGAIRFQGIFVGEARDFNDETTGGERQLFRASVDLDISWNEEV
ncbi:DUF3168 domain-containing protein [Thalassococcus sp. S3]|uniref:tail completion protein gp17 n=1 Tax=Thalassococcus sp. S3 TaxID=2017482 RepID=UPI0010245D36|nr:DUF3168 domain-containing protein [Thalassococcus sp. S3]QBF32146.1 hypothetical protein CFI11_13085 [Thalassococcus sp. S3]